METNFKNAKFLVAFAVFTDTHIYVCGDPDFTAPLEHACY